ncbi:hypothetical protein CAPTEDRAFT_185906 [Capitella teleta]|uniref:Uncharacterized protein n=1 Tax=Capitella teleta TaxID=283909 RepID=R7TD90_CAPTE|nr:hypothetical protein CAPTEDRAFT_185906 [Capitella teleta]|eukprot:ELT91703.1 hypothetical protein CAPTEDRAFT_185906 [Capitella teleta]
MTSVTGAVPMRGEGKKPAVAVVARRRSSRLYRELIDGEVASGEATEWDAPSSPVKLLSVRYLGVLTPELNPDYVQLRKPAGGSKEEDSLSKKIRIRKKYKSVSSVPDYSESNKKKWKASERLSYHPSFAMEDVEATPPNHSQSSSCKTEVNGGPPQMDGDAQEIVAITLP